jgi:acetolactate synthase-1/2/3 large subunit
MPKMTGAQCLADMLAGYGVSHVFMVPAILRRTMAELERRTGIKRLHCHGEKSAAYMADGYARASGKPGICMAQQVGGLNLAAGLRDAWLAHAPVIAMTGGTLPRDRYRHVYQEADNFAAFGPYVKWNATVDAAQRIPDMVRQAFRVATSGRPGPVHLQFQGFEGQVDVEEAELDPAAETQFARVPPFRPQPEPARIAEAQARLARAERPVIVAGGGCRASGARVALRAFAERMGIPVATSLNGRDSIPNTHPLSVGVVGSYSRASACDVVAEADLVVFVGSTAGSLVTHFWTLPRPGTAVIQIDIEPSAIGRNYTDTLGIHADARAALEALLAAADAAAGTAGPARRNAWLARVDEICRDWRKANAHLRESEAVPIRPERIAGEISGLLPEDCIVVVDTGHAGMWMGGMYDLAHDRQRYMRSAGHLGWAFPAGLGAKCAAPDRPVFVFTGDLGIWYHIAEIETAVRWNIRTVTLVNNNRSGNQSMAGYGRAYEGKATEKSRELWVHNPVDFARIAEEIGALGLRVEKPSELKPALARAFAADRPAVIDVVTDMDAIAPGPKWEY